MTAHKPALDDGGCHRYTSRHLMTAHTPALDDGCCHRHTSWHSMTAHKPALNDSGRHWHISRHSMPVALDAGGCQLAARTRCAGIHCLCTLPAPLAGTRCREVLLHANVAPAHVAGARCQHPKRGDVTLKRRGVLTRARRHHTQTRRRPHSRAEAPHSRAEAPSLKRGGVLTQVRSCWCTLPAPIATTRCRVVSDCTHAMQPAHVACASCQHPSQAHVARRSCCTSHAAGTRCWCTQPAPHAGTRGAAQAPGRQVRCAAQTRV